LLVCGVMFFYFSLQSFAMLLFSNILFGVGLSLVLPYIELIALTEIGKEKYGKSRLFGSIGFMGVALVLVKFLTHPLVALNYLVVLTCVTVVFAFLTVFNAHSTKHNTVEYVSEAMVLKDWQLWVGFALMQVGFGAFYNFFTIYETAHGISMDTTVYLWSFGVLIEIAMLYFQGRVLGGNLLGILQFTTFVTILRWLILFWFADSLVMLFVSQSLHALSFALFHSAAISYLFVLYANKPLAQQLFSGISYGLGALLGAVSSGYIYQYFPEQLFLFSAVVTSAALYFFYIYSKKRNKI